MANIAHIHQTLFNYAPNNASPYDSNGDRRHRLHAYLLGVLDAGHRRIAIPECSIDTETTQCKMRSTWLFPSRATQTDRF